MRNIKLTIAYDGTDYSGWQRQKSSLTIQGEIERRLQLITNSSVSLYGAGRTDAGVHARGMVANFHTEAPIPCPALLRGLNGLLPQAIRILDACEVVHDFHARYSAKSKTYTYALFTGPIQFPMHRLYAVQFPHVPHQERIQPCLEMIRGTHDFASFEAAGSRDFKAASVRGAIRTLHEATFTRTAPESYQFQFTADGFLRHMVRNLVGTLLEVGKGRRSVLEFEQILLARKRSAAGPTAPAHGLVLEKIFY
ncbi:MAG: tRNA pseudouridine(38-40) synthase TruA [Desulfoarculaceae bacterium]|nr:tRNA pseudouridine(38-40) synthase TruA [Desulfoarculaceae bacterium]